MRFDCFFFFQAEDGIRDFHVTGVQTCALPISLANTTRRVRRPTLRVPALLSEWELSREEGRARGWRLRERVRARSLNDWRSAMADNRGVAYLGPGEVEVQS